MITRRALLAAPIVFAGCSREPGTGFPGFAYVANRGGRSIAAVDLNGFSVRKRVTFDAAPEQVIAPAERSKIFALTPENGTLHELDTATLAIGRRVTVAPRAAAMQLNPAGTALWFLSTEARRLIRVPLDDFRADAEIALPQKPGGFHLSPRGGLAAVTFPATQQIALVDLEGKRCGPPVAAGGTIGAIRFQSDGRAIIAANVSDRRLSIFEAPSGKLIVHLPLAVQPENLCFKADGGQLFVTGSGLDAVVVVYPYHTPQVAETVLAGREPGAMAASAMPPYLFVSNPKSGDVSILNITTRKMIATVRVGTEPSYIVVTPDDQFALVLNKASGDMAVLRVGAITAQRNKRAPLFTMIPIGSEPVSAAVRLS